MDIFEKRKKRKRKRKRRSQKRLGPVLDPFAGAKHLKGTQQLTEVFSPLLLLFEVKPSGNLFKDFGVLADKIKDERYFLQRIFSKIFDQYDRNGDGVVDKFELKMLLKDVGAAVGDPKLQNISSKRLKKILERIDTNQNGLVERHELVGYLVQWVDYEEDFSPVPAIPPFRSDASYYPMHSSEGSIGALSDLVAKDLERAMKKPPSPNRGRVGEKEGEVKTEILLNPNKTRTSPGVSSNSSMSEEDVKINNDVGRVKYRGVGKSEVKEEGYEFGKGEGKKVSRDMTERDYEDEFEEDSYSDVLSGYNDFSEKDGGYDEKDVYEESEQDV